MKNGQRLDIPSGLKVFGVTIQAGPEERAAGSRVREVKGPSGLKEALAAADSSSSSALPPAQLQAPRRLAILKFEAPWCRPCKFVEPTFVEISQQPGYRDIQFLRINLDENRILAEQFKVDGIPTFVMLVDGQEVQRVQGANLERLTKTVEEFATMHLPPPAPSEGADVRESKSS